MPANIKRKLKKPSKRPPKYYPLHSLTELKASFLMIFIALFNPLIRFLLSVYEPIRVNSTFQFLRKEFRGAKSEFS
ncbi:MAG TPA: hypothetical protein DCR40_11575 [Prolixibacteraceae bacterium]|nr:hypothetical protein [Prolixibacteraceae bacterium]